MARPKSEPNLWKSTFFCLTSGTLMPICAKVSKRSSKAFGDKDAGLEIQQFETGRS